MVFFECYIHINSQNAIAIQNKVQLCGNTTNNKNQNEINERIQENNTIQLDAKGDRGK